MTMRRVWAGDYAFNQHDLGRFFQLTLLLAPANDYRETRDIDDKPSLNGTIAELPPA